MKNLQRQRGITLMGLVFVLVVVSTVGLVALRLLPFYTEYQGVVRAMEQLKEKQGMATTSKTDLKNQILNLLYLNDVREIKHGNFKEHFKLKQVSGGRNITADYRREAHFAFNVYLLVKFEHTIELKR